MFLWSSALWSSALGVGIGSAQAQQMPAGCTFYADGERATKLDCEAGGAWTVRCDAPSSPAGKLRVRAALEGGPSGEARISLGDASPSRQEPLEFRVSGPGGRPGAFTVAEAAGTLLPGQAVGPNDWCPVVQPDVAPGSPRAQRWLTVTLTAHERTGFAEEVQAGGVINRVPVYGPGVEVGSGSIVVVQRVVGTVPVLTGPIVPPEEPVRGSLSLGQPDGTWRSFGFSGTNARIEVDTGTVRVLVVDFVTPEVAAATGQDAAAWLRADLERWLSGDDSAWLGIAAWQRSELHRPVQVAWVDRAERGRTWSIGATERAELRIGRFGDRTRVTIAWHTAPWDGPALNALADAVGEGL